MSEAKDSPGAQGDGAVRMSQAKDPPGAQGDGAVALVVDVDGTLVAGDLLLEGFIRLLSTAPLRALVLLLSLRRGRAALKRAVAGASPLDPKTLRLDRAVLAEIEEAKQTGRPVWLASGADSFAVAPLAERVGATGFLASDGATNLVGGAKAAALVDRFGRGGFDYVGNAPVDLAVWRQARRAIVVNPSAWTRRRLSTLDAEPRVLPASRDGIWKDWLTALRPHQWTKNVLVFVPLLAAHVVDAGAWLSMAGVFAALCCCASGTYILNDLLDLAGDRRHPAKCDRPIAAGRVPLSAAAGAGALLVMAGMALAVSLSAGAAVGLALYLCGTVGYSLWFKRWLFLDVVALAMLYAVRVGMGATEAAPLSPWLVAFSLFFFMALATAKRQTELVRDVHAESLRVNRRAYRPEDTTAVLALGAGSTFASIVVLALYIQSPDVAVRYARPEILGILGPLLICWLGRLLLLANRGSIDYDPIVFALRDRASWIVAVIGLACVAGAI